MATHARKAELLQGARERPRKAGRRGNRREIAQRSRVRGVKHRPGRHRFGTEPRARRRTFVGQRRQSRSRSELHEAEPLHAERR